MSDPKYKNIGHPGPRVIEECAELTKAICKAMRFGWRNHHPDRLETNNTYEVLAEIQDVREALDYLERRIPELI